MANNPIAKADEKESPKHIQKRSVAVQSGKSPLESVLREGKSGMVKRR